MMKKTSSSQQVQNIAVPAVSFLPGRFLLAELNEYPKNLQAYSPAQVVCPDETPNVLTRCTVKNISDSLASFFNKSWQNAFQQKYSSQTSTLFIYDPSWLREHVVFLHSTSRNASIKFTRCSLRINHQIRESGQKQSASVIIYTWIQRKAGSALELLNYYLDMV